MCTAASFGFSTSIQVSNPGAVHPSARYQVLAGEVTPIESWAQIRFPDAVPRAAPTRGAAPASRAALTDLCAPTRGAAPAGADVLLTVEAGLARQPEIDAIISIAHRRANGAASLFGKKSLISFTLLLKLSKPQV
jgi:hypothetical protein